MSDGEGRPAGRGYRGYAGARLAMGRSVPHGVQQLVMREYCASRGLEYLLAATEYIMPGSTLILDGLLADLEQVEGLVFYSLALLPARRSDRLRVYARVIDGGRSLHLAAERLVVRDPASAARVEDIWLLAGVEAPGADALRYLSDWDRGHAGA